MSASGPRRWPRPYGLDPLRYPVETTAGERVYIIRDEHEGGIRILTAEDGRRFTPSSHGLRVEPLPEP